MCINPQNKVHKFKKSHNKNLKSKKNRKRTCWKTTAFLRKWHIINNIIPKCRWILLTKKIFEIETVKVLVKNPPGKWTGLCFFCACFCFVTVVCLFVCLF